MFVAVTTLVISVSLAAYLTILNRRMEAEPVTESGTTAPGTIDYKRELAKADAARMTAQKATLIRLLDSIEREISETNDSKRITTLLSKQSSTEAKIYNLDHKIEQAYYTVYGR